MIWYLVDAAELLILVCYPPLHRWISGRDSTKRSRHALSFCFVFLVSPPHSFCLGGAQVLAATAAVTQATVPRVTNNNWNRHQHCFPVVFRQLSHHCDSFVRIPAGVGGLSHSSPDIASSAVTASAKRKEPGTPGTHDLAWLTARTIPLMLCLADALPADGSEKRAKLTATPGSLQLTPGPLRVARHCSRADQLVTRLFCLLE
jgi:hypothetical protein